MARIADPERAARVSTGVSHAERAALERIARERRVNLADVARWALVEYLGRCENEDREPVRAVAAS